MVLSIPTMPAIPPKKSALIVLKEHEIRLIGEIEAYLDTKFPEESYLVRERFRCLQRMGDAISHYPSVRETQIMQGKQRGEESLIASLCEPASASHLLHIPTRVVAVRSFLVAKFHAFSLVSMLVRDIHEFHTPLHRIIFTIICTLMVEEVYFSCLRDPVFSHDTKIRLANDLISLWDSGQDSQIIHHFPALESLWIARDTAPPCFGTMDGTSELFRISMDLGQDWQEFLVAEINHNETRWALEEFLFGLSYEDILNVRSRLARFGISAVGYDEVRSFLGNQPAYGMISSTDPRTIYDFYVNRRDAAQFRKRSVTPGPQQTLEAIYLKYRLTLELE
ncbi:MAG: hypothetical protein LBT13_08390 [Treponema sp.]|jgi:hypothetical protein|nr:hypothetical protein [Treponema sp.]